MKNKKQKEKKWILVVAIICIITGMSIRIDWTPNTMIFSNPTIEFHVQQVEAKEESTKVMSIEDKIRATFYEEPELALAIAKRESGLRHDTKSNTDLMADGRSFSFGLMQINLTVHKLGNTDCTKAFEGRNYNATVVNEDLYAECVKLAINPDINLETARGIYDRSGKNFGKWGAYTNGSYKIYL